MGGRLTPEVSDLLERAASLPFGLQLLRMAPAACVSSTLGACLDVVVEVQRALEDERGAGELLRAYEELAARRTRHPHEPLPPPLPGAPQPRGPAELIAEAEASAGGLRVLLEEPLETIAIQFCVHPFVVEAARDILAERGLVAEGADPDR